MDGFWFGFLVSVVICCDLVLVMNMVFLMLGKLAVSVADDNIVI